MSFAIITHNSANKNDLVQLLPVAKFAKSKCFPQYLPRILQKDPLPRRFRGIGQDQIKVKNSSKINKIQNFLRTQTGNKSISRKIRDFLRNFVRISSSLKWESISRILYFRKKKIVEFQIFFLNLN